MAGSLQSWNRRVRPRLLLRNRTPLSSRVVHRVIGHLSSCIWNLRVFPDDATRVSVPLRVVTSSTGLHSKRSPGIGFLSRVDGEIGVFWNVARPTRPLLEFLCETSLLLRCDGKVGIPFQTKQGNRPSCRDQEGRRGSDYVVLVNSLFLSSETCMSGNFLCCINGIKYHFEFKREREISLQTLQWEGASSHDDRGTSWFFSNWGRILKLGLGTQGASRVASGKCNLHLSCEGELGISLQGK